MVYKKFLIIVLVFSAAPLLFAIDGSNIPQWVINTPSGNNEVEYFVGSAKGRTASAAEENAVYIIAEKISNRYCKNIKVPNTQYEIGQYVIVEIMDENPGYVICCDKYQQIINGLYECNVLYSVSRKLLNALEKQTKGLTNQVFYDGIEKAVYFSAVQLLMAIPEDSKVAIINVASMDVILGEFAFEELAGYLTSKSTISVFDRKSLESLRQEQHFQMTAEVAESTAIGIGHYSGANVVITGTISGTGNLRRLRFKALDVKSAKILAQTSNAF